jgi:hypothetical protein
MIVINNIALPEPPKSMNTDEADRIEENLFIFGPRALDDFYRCKHTKLMEEFDIESTTGQMMFMLPHLAIFFGVDKNKLLESWMSNFGMGHLDSFRP